MVRLVGYHQTCWNMGAIVMRVFFSEGKGGGGCADYPQLNKTRMYRFLIW